jgi:hypothetical protein
VPPTAEGTWHQCSSRMLPCANWRSWSQVTEPAEGAVASHRLPEAVTPVARSGRASRW